jgi:hypothetical protein
MTSEPSTATYLREEYANTFFPELSPTRLNYVAALGGVEPVALDAPFAYLELGCGLGHSTVANAGAFAGADFHGCDVNPAHAAKARGFADRLGVRNFTVHERAFDALPGLDLPPFQFIVLHGVYSWVDAAARRAIGEIIRRKLSPGGLVYLSYNCMPGWASEAPVRRLMVELAAGAGGPASQARGAALALKAFQDLHPRYFAEAPAAARAIGSYLDAPGEYLAHEFLTEAWEPFYSIDVHEEMAALGLGFVGSATLPDNHPTLITDERTAARLGEQPDPRLRTLMEDFAVNRRFRRDVFASPAPARRPGHLGHPLLRAIVGRPDGPGPLPAKAKVPLGAVSFQQEFVEALGEALASGPRPIGEIVRTLSAGGREPAQITRNLLFLAAAGELSPFARAEAYEPDAGPPYSASPMLEATLGYIIENGSAQAAPSELLGNGVLIQPPEARVLTRHLAGQGVGEDGLGDDPALERRVWEVLIPKLVRLQLLRGAGRRAASAPAP